jgi:cysteine-rich repeat protein
VNRFVLVALLHVSGCTFVADSLLRDPVRSCEGKADGTPCQEAEFCVQGACIFSACGDGYLDLDKGEVCDDGNLVSGDGCEPGVCRYSCETPIDCEDANPCRATMGCNADTHTCRGFSPTSGASCEANDGSSGTCITGLCRAEGCGDGTVVAPEECDDTTPGCAADCTFVCETDAECVSEDVCADPQMCDVPTHTCVPSPPLVCDDGDACTTDGCDPVLACVDVVIDGDVDGYSPGACGPGSEAMGGDCNDGDPDIRPGAPEAVDGVDQDCDLVIDENPGVNCLRDMDGDGFGNPNDSVFASTCPEGYVPPRARNDCQDANANVSPAQMNPSTFPYCPAGSMLMGQAGSFTCSGGSGNKPSWDWNCDGQQTPSSGQVLMCANAQPCAGTGWTGSVPACGASGTSITCTRVCTLGLICSCQSSTTPNVPQYCL